MTCSECIWCALNSPARPDRICCNVKSPNYNQTIPALLTDEMGCDAGESKREHDYRNMTPWQFASKYYM